MTEPRIGVCENLPDLDRIVRLSGLDSQSVPPHKFARFELVDVDQQRFKVRAYRHSDTAERQFRLLSMAPHLFSRCYGRMGTCLVFDHTPDVSVECSPHTFSDVGSFMAELASVSAPPLPQDEFDRWCSDLETGQVFLPHTLRLIRRHYDTQMQSRPIRWGLEYYVPSLGNFVRAPQGSLISVDEKHLFLAPRGTGLVKPERSYPAEVFDDLKAAYCGRLGFKDFDDPTYHEFLVFYYCISMMAFFAHNRRWGPNLDMPRMHWMRRRILRMVESPIAMRAVEEASWLIPRRLREWWKFGRRAAGYARRQLAVQLPSPEKRERGWGKGGPS